MRVWLAVLFASLGRSRRSAVLADQLDRVSLSETESMILLAVA